MSSEINNESPNNENDENELVEHVISGNASNKKFEQMISKLSARNKQLKERHVMRRIESKKVDFDVIEQSFVEQTDEKDVVVSRPLSCEAEEPVFRVPSLPQPDISAISFDHMNDSCNSTLVDNAPISSTPMVPRRTRVRVTQQETEPVFKAPTLPPPRPLSARSSTSDFPSRANSRNENRKRDESIERPLTASSVPDFYLSVDEKMQKQLDALAAWGNCLLKAGIERDEVDFGKTKEDARRALSRLLQKAESDGIKREERIHTYRDWVQRRRMDEYRQKCMSLFTALEYRVSVTKTVSMGQIAVRKGLKVYADISLQTSLLRILFSFHPLWLHLGLETVFNTVIDVRIGDNFALKMARFIQERLFVNKNLLKLKKMSKNGKTSLVTPEGDRALHHHFLQHFTLILIAIEEFKRNHLIEYAPRMFTRASGYKCMNDIFSDFSRELLSASAKPYPKALASVGFVPTYKQTFIEEANYHIAAISDLQDGVILGKLVEIVTDSPCNSIMTQLRNPGGDRIRKIGNVQVILDSLKQRDIDTRNVSAQNIVASNKDAVLELLWRLVGFYTEKCGLPYKTLATSERIGGCEQDQREDSCDRVLNMCKEVGDRIGVQVSDYTSLRDGRVLAELWSIYAGPAHPLTVYSGDELFERVYNAADIVLGVPRCVFDDARSINLFVHIFVARLADMHHMQRSATVIQKWWRAIKRTEMIKNITAMTLRDEQDIEKTVTDERDSLHDAPLLAEERSLREQQEIEEFEELERSITSPVSDVAGRTYLVIDGNTPSGENAKGLNEEVVAPKETNADELHAIKEEANEDAELNEVELPVENGHDESIGDEVEECPPEELELSSHEHKFVDELCRGIVEEDICADCGRENCGNFQEKSDGEEEDPVPALDDAHPVPEVEDMFEMLRLQEEFEKEENTQQTHEEESDSEAEREDEEADELFAALKEEQEHLAHENEEELLKVDAEEQLIENENHEIDQECDLDADMCQLGDLTIPRDSDNEENHGDYILATADDDELAELEKSLSHGNAIGGGIVLERSMIGGEVSFGWRENELEQQDDDDKEVSQEELDPTDNATEDKYAIVPIQTSDATESSESEPLKSRSCVDPFSGFEMRTDLNEIKQIMFIESLSAANESQVIDEHELSQDERVVLNRHASEEGIEIAVEGLVEDSSKDATDFFNNGTIESTEEQKSVVDEDNLRFPTTSSRLPTLDPLIEVYLRIKELQKEQDSMKKLLAEAESLKK